MSNSFIEYLIKNKKLSIRTVKLIQSRFSYADYEVENKINDVIELLIECELDPNTYLFDYPEILDLANIEDREQLNEILSYIRDYVKKNKKNKNKYILLNVILASKEIIEKQKQEESEMIIALLQTEGLIGIFEPKINKSKAKVEKVLHASYAVVNKNIQILKKESMYRELVYENPLILINENEKEVEQALKEFQEKIASKDKSKKNDEENEEEKKKRELKEKIEKEKENRKKEKDNDEDDGKEIKISGHSISLEEERLLKLGDEEKVLPVLETFNRYGIPYNILNTYPDILRSGKPSNISDILDLLYMNNIPFAVLYECPEILQRGKADEIRQVIEELKTRGLSLTVVINYPEILINSSPDRIRQLVIALEEKSIDKYILYSSPDILMYGDIDKYVDLLKDIDEEMTNDMVEIIQMLPNRYVEFKEVEESIEQRYIDVANEKIYKKHTDLGKEVTGILLIDNIKSAKQILNTLDAQGIDTEIVSKEPKILKQPEEKVEQIAQKIKSNQLGFNILVQDPNIMIKSDEKKIDQVVEKIKQYRPETCKKIVKSYPALLYMADTKNMDKVFNQLSKNSINVEIVDKVPNILLRKEPEEITKVVGTLNKKGYTQNDIMQVPEILARGKEKYIERNFVTFEKNDIKIPLNVVHCISARNNEKNIDVLIENNLDRYIEKTPEILELKNSRLMQMLEIANKNNISVLKNRKNKEKNEKETVFNMEYFKLTDEQLSTKYELDIKEIKDIGVKAEKEEKKLRRVKNEKLYQAVCPILEKQVKKELKDYELDKVSYMNNNKRVSKQKVIREAYLDLEQKVEKEGKEVIKTLNVENLLIKKLFALTKNSTKKVKEEKEVGRSEKL